MHCIDQEYGVSGHYDSDVATNLMVVYEVCNPKKRKCKDPKIIEEAITASYILLIDNEQRYNH